MIQRWFLLLVTLATSLGLAAPALADDFRPAYLQLSQTSPTTYDVLWKVPALNESTSLKVQPAFPPGTINLTPQRSSFANGVAVQRCRIHIADGLESQSIAFPGLSEVRMDVLARLTRSDGSVQLERIPASDPRFTVGAVGLRNCAPADRVLARYPPTALKFRRVGPGVVARE